MNGYNETDALYKCGGNTYQSKTKEEIDCISEKIKKTKIGELNPNSSAILQAYFPFIDSSKIICISDKGLLNGDVMVDDCVDKLISNLYCHRICFEKPWNMSVHDEVYGIHRCANWDEIIDTIEKLYKEDLKLMEE